MAVAVVALVNGIALSNVGGWPPRRSVDLNADSSSVTFRGHTSGSAFAGSSGRSSLSSPQFALL